MPHPKDPGVRRRMRTQKRRDTGTELAVRRRLHSMGLRYRVDFRPVASLLCRGDIVFTRRRLVIFIDGCFWHACPIHGTTPQSNASWWRTKLAENVERDARNTDALLGIGWTVVRIWEHESVDVAVDRILLAYHSLGGRQAR